MDAWNPRFVAYAAAHGRTPAEQLAHDKAENATGWMLPFMVWAAVRA